MKSLKGLDLNQVEIGTKVKLINGLGTYKVTATIYSSYKGNECVISNGCGSSLIVKFEDLVRV